MNDQWRQWLAACAAGGEADVSLRELYGRMDADIAARSPTCWLSGKCCHFDEYGHLLYVTGLEIAWVVGRTPGARGLTPAAKHESRDCPYQNGKLCQVHAVRPLGCRIFYCDPAAQGWQHEMYERYLGELRMLHDRLGLTYRYMEWRAGLTEALAVGKIHS
ncbi:MAG: CxxCxxCC domain-containing protein [Phycisphaerales bacterium]